MEEEKIFSNSFDEANTIPTGKPYKNITRKL